MKRLHAIVIGRVQGVFLRDFVRGQAERMQVTGWVRNLPDGTVEVLAEGEDDAITFFLTLLSRGSSHAHVEDVQATYTEVSGEFSGFHIRY
jgi:acylphosphatase